MISEGSGTYLIVDDSSLVEQVKQGDREAWALLYRRHAQALYRFVYYRVGMDQAAAEDIFHDAVISAIEGIRMFRGESAFYGWLCGIAKFKISHYRRSVGRELPWSVMMDHADGRLQDLGDVALSNERTDAGLLNDERRELVDAALSALPSHYQEALVRKYVDDQSVDRIARELAVSAKAVESLLSRARAAFKVAFSVVSEEEGMGA